LVDYFYSNFHRESKILRDNNIGFLRRKEVFEEITEGTIKEAYILLVF